MHPQPVPPIFQPEVAARAIAWAAEHYRREWFVTARTPLGVATNKIMPGLLDWYLGRTGYSSQQAPWPIEPGRPHNLWRPLPAITVPAASSMSAQNREARICGSHNVDAPSLSPLESSARRWPGS